MIFDLQLFDAGYSPQTGIALGTNGSDVIEIGSTGGIGTTGTSLISNVSYEVGFVYDASGKKAGLDVAEDGQKAANASVSYIDLNSNGSVETNEIVDWEVAGQTGTLSDGGIFQVGGSYVVPNGSSVESYSDGALVWNTISGTSFLTDGGWSTLTKETGLSAFAVTTLLTSFSTSTATSSFGVAGASLSITYIDVDNSGTFNVGDIVTGLSSAWNGSGVSSINVFGTSFSWKGGGGDQSWTGQSIYTGSSTVGADLGTGASFTDVIDGEDYDLTKLFYADSLSFVGVENDEFTRLTATSDQYADALSSLSITSGTNENPVSWDTTTSTFMNVSSDREGVGVISHVELMADVLAGDTKAYTLNLNNGYVSSVSLGGYQMNLALTSVSKGGVTIDGLDMATGVNRTITFNGQSAQKMNVVGETINKGRLYVTNNKYNADFLSGTEFQNVGVSGTKNGSMTFTSKNGATNTFNFGENTDSVTVSMGGDGAVLNTRAEGAELVTINNLRGTVNITGLKDKSNYVLNGLTGYDATVTVSDSNGQADTIDTKSTVSIIGAENDVSYSNNAWNWGGTITANLSGKGVESVNIANHGADVNVTNDWVFTTRSISGAAGANVVSIDEHGILDIEGSILGNENYGAKDSDANLAGATRSSESGDEDNQYMYLGTHMQDSGDSDKIGEDGNASRLVIRSAATNGIQGESQLFGSYEGILIESQGKTYNALMMSADSLSASDTALNWSSYDIVVGDVLDLGDRTDKKVVFLNNGLDDNDWGETISYSANMTSVISSSAGKSLIIGDFENKINFYANGDQDSLYGGYAYGIGGYDTLASAGGKKAWMGTSDNSGLTKVELLHNGSNTYNFGFSGEDYDNGTETDDTADVVALMNGAAYLDLQGSEHKRANFAIGADSANNFTFQSISEGVHDIMYTYDLGANNYKARVDTSLKGSSEGYNYADDVNFYLGFDNGTVLTMNTSDSGKKLNYGGTNVIQGISTIDGSAAAGGNILNGQIDHAEYIVASDKVGDTLSGGLSNDYADATADTLVGGAGADTFWVGANMGNDIIQNVTDGDTIVFLGSKFADATLNYENDRMEDRADSHWMSVSFKDGSTITITPGDGVTTHLHDVTNVTAIADDGTWVWDGSTWSKSE